MAKIKNVQKTVHTNRPRGVKQHSFERVYWPYIPIVLAISFLLVVGSSSGTLKAAIHHPLGKVLSYSSSMSVGGLLADTNAERTANSVPDLNLNKKLDAAAQAKANDMAARNYWSHYTPEGNPPWIFVTAQGYSYQKLGENLAAGFDNEQSTINGWMASPPHRENLLDPAFSDVGFGYANNPDYTSAGGGPMTIVVAFYGKPQVLSTTTTTTVNTGTNSTPVAPVQTRITASQRSKALTAAKISSPPKTDKPKAASTTNTPETKTVASSSTSRLQLALRDFPFAKFSTSLAILGSLAIMLYWITRHLRAFKKFVFEGEQYVINHPLSDIGLVVIAALLFILSQTAGLIQ